MKRKMSQEERFLHKLHSLAMEKGDPLSAIDRHKVGGEIGENFRSIDNTVQILTKNCLLKKGEEKEVSLTPLGVRFVEEAKGLLGA